MTAPALLTVVYPVTDLDASTAAFTALLGEPTTQAPYYVGFSVEGHEIGLDPSGHFGASGPVPYWHVEDVAASLADLVAAGATTLKEPSDVGGGTLVAIALVGGNPVGLRSL